MLSFRKLNIIFSVCSNGQDSKQIAWLNWFCSKQYRQIIPCLWPAYEQFIILEYYLEVFQTFLVITEPMNCITHFWVLIC